LFQGISGKVDIVTKPRLKRSGVTMGGGERSGKSWASPKSLRGEWGGKKKEATCGS